MDRRVNDLIEEANARLADTFAVHQTPISTFLEGLAGLLVQHEELSESEAEDLVRDSTVELINFGRLSPLPSDTDHEAQVAWIEEADQFGILGYLLGRHQEA